MLLSRRLMVFSFVIMLSPLAVASEKLEQVRVNLQKYLGDIPKESIQPSPVKGMYRVSVPPRVFYISADGQYVFNGDLIDLKNGINITQQERQQGVLKTLKQVDEKDMIVFKAKNQKHLINVFTDIDCGYCRKLHSAVPEYNKLGITVRYLAFPRAGIGSPSYKKAVAVWCAKDRHAAMTQAKSGVNLPEASCNNPVASQHRLGNLLGVTGTPAIIMENGQLIPGFVPPARLNAMLNNPMGKN